MTEARASIKEKLRKIAEQQDKEEVGVKHNPSEFSFTKYHRLDMRP